MRQRFLRIVDTSKHLGMPIKMAVIVLQILTFITEAYSFVFLPWVAFGCLTGLAAVASFFTLMSVLCNNSGLAIAALTMNILSIIPVYVVIYFTVYTLCLSDCYIDSSYGEWLCDQSTGFLWSGLISAFFASAFAGLLMTGLRKLRFFQQGHTTYLAAGRHGRAAHNVHVTTVTQSQPNVIAVPTATVVYPANQQPYQQQQYPQQYQQTTTTTTVYPQVNQVPQYPQPAYPAQQYYAPQQPTTSQYQMEHPPMYQASALEKI